MKKGLVLSAFAVFGVLALSSCKKDYTCSWTSGDETYSQTYTGLSKSEAEAQEVNCKFVGGTWAKK